MAPKRKGSTQPGQQQQQQGRPATRGGSGGVQTRATAAAVDPTGAAAARAARAQARSQTRAQAAAAAAPPPAATAPRRARPPAPPANDGGVPLLPRVLQLLDAASRQAAVRVSRAWAAAIASNTRAITIHSTAWNAADFWDDSDSRTSLDLWLQRHGRGLTCLRLGASPYISNGAVWGFGWDDDYFGLDEGEFEHKCSHYLPALEGLTRFTALQELALPPMNLECPYIYGLLGMRKLRSLGLDDVSSLECWRVSDLASVLTRLAALDSLSLAGYSGYDATHIAAALPRLSRLTALTLLDDLAVSAQAATALPSGLQALKLGLGFSQGQRKHLLLSAASYPCLSGLTALRSLELSYVAVDDSTTPPGGAAPPAALFAGVQLTRFELTGPLDNTRSIEPSQPSRKHQPPAAAATPPPPPPPAAAAAAGVPPQAPGVDDGASDLLPSAATVGLGSGVAGLLHWLGTQTQLQHLSLDECLPHPVGGTAGCGMCGLFDWGAEGEEESDPQLLQLYAGLVHTSLRHLSIEGMLASDAGQVAFGGLAAGDLRHLTYLHLACTYDASIDAPGCASFLSKQDVETLGRACTGAQLQELVLWGAADGNADLHAFAHVASTLTRLRLANCGVGGVSALTALRDLHLHHVQSTLHDYEAFAEHLTRLTHLQAICRSDKYGASDGPLDKLQGEWIDGMCGMFCVLELGGCPPPDWQTGCKGCTWVSLLDPDGTEPVAVGLARRAQHGRAKVAAQQAAWRARQAECKAEAHRQAAAAAAPAGDTDAAAAPAGGTDTAAAPAGDRDAAAAPAGDTDTAAAPVGDTDAVVAPADATDTGAAPVGDTDTAVARAGGTDTAAGDTDAAAAPAGDTDTAAAEAGAAPAAAAPARNDT